MDKRSLNIIEYNEILKLLEEEAGSIIAKEKAMSIIPSTDLEETRKMLSETEEAFNIITCENISTGGIRDIREPLKIASISGRLDESQLLDISGTLCKGKEIHIFFSDKITRYPLLYNLTKYLRPYQKIQDAINSSISPAGEINSNASPKLASLRHTIENLKNGITSKMGDIIKSSWGKMLQEPIITTREGRYVLPVKSEFKGKFKGIVHDQSVSGVTLFMEPLALVESNNRLKKSQIEEKEEIDAILRKLSGMITAEAEGIKENLHTLTELDLIIARGKLAHKLKAVKPNITEKKKLRIIKGRHPLLKGEIVPITIDMGDKFICLVITGPNTGGKTVTLKMAGLFPLMAQSGLFVPAEEGTSFSIWKNIFADIGDEQSIAQSLSTFSSHIKQIINILSGADEYSIVLLDELGAGTDPSEGAVLGISILESLIEKKCLTIVTTHHNRLKAFAAIHPKAENASVDFDLETLRPVYNLTMGQPGRSQAIHIAERLGMPENIIEKAKNNLSKSSYEVDELLEKLRNDSNILSEEKIAISLDRAELEEMQARASKKLDEAERERKRIIEELKEKSRKLLSDTEKEMKEIKSNLRKLFKKEKPVKIEDTLKIIDELKDKLNLEEQIVEEFIEEFDPSPEPPEKIISVRQGDYVKIISLGLEGYISDVFQGQEEVKIQAGLMNITAKISDLAPAKPYDMEEYKEYDGMLTGGKIISISPEINLISKRVEDALITLEKYIDDAYLARLQDIRIVHGKGTGALRNAIRDYLKTSPLIEAFRLGGVGEGGAGVTIAELKL